MQTQNDIHFEFNAPVSPELAYSAIAQPKAWWHTAIEGHSAALHDTFTVRFSDCDFVRFTVSEAEPARRFVWHVDECFLQWFQDKTEWTGTDVIFEIAPTPDGCAVQMTHRGLTPEVECYAMCNAGWEGHFMTGLRNLMTEGVGISKG